MSKAHSVPSIQMSETRKGSSCASALYTLPFGCALYLLANCILPWSGLFDIPDLLQAVVEIESASLDYSCDQDKKENGISGCLCEVQRQTDG